MIRQLKRRVVIAAMISVTVVLIFIIGAINILNYQSITRDLDDVLTSIHNNNGQIPEEKDNDTTGQYRPIEGFPASVEQPYRDRYLSMICESDGSFVITNNPLNMHPEKAYELGGKLVHKDNSSGSYISYGYYRYYVGTGQRENGDVYKRVTLIDSSITMGNYYTFFALSIAVSVVSLLIIFVMMMIFATKIIAPIAESYEKQKRFITDAGHDIKTPITIIDADREILEMDIGDNEWLEDIKKQTKRLTKLTNDLIYLSRMEEGTDIKELSSFSISDVCLEEADSFSAVAKTKDLEIKHNIEKSIDINGSEGDVRKLLAILFDNAVKYAKPGSEITIETKKQGRMAVVTISNVAENLTEEQSKKMFDRFYRTDNARGSEGGFGIGLAMAQAITLSHNGKISAELSEDHVLSISASFPIQYGSFKLITNFVDKTSKNANLSSQNTKDITKTSISNIEDYNDINAPEMDESLSEFADDSDPIFNDEEFITPDDEEHISSDVEQEKDISNDKEDTDKDTGEGEET